MACPAVEALTTIRAMLDEQVPLVSVCIPCRNGAAELSNTLTNLLSHCDFPKQRLEVLLGDHGSTDATAAVAADFQRRFPQLQRVFIPFTSANRSQVRNALLARAEGEIIVFIDHDVLVSEGFLRAHVAAHAAFPAALVAGETYGRAIAGVDAARQACRGLDLEHIASSYSELSRRPELADPRRKPGRLPPGVGLMEVTGVVAPFRFFWTCNLSARRRDILECGQFDEAYVGWGLEDDDFAHRFYLGGKSLVFSQAAWAFHVPHAVDPWKNMRHWRRNFEHIRDKFGTRELEYYSLYGGEIEAGARRMAGVLTLVAQVDQRLLAARAAPLQGERKGRRLLHFCADPSVAHTLEATDVLDPSGPGHVARAEREGVRFWHRFGVETTFTNAEIDETLVLVEVFARLDRHLLMLVLAEVARISRHVAFYVTTEPADSAEASAFQGVLAVANTLRFSSATWNILSSGRHVTLALPTAAAVTSS
jgi:glycosyltransferase involved in cell wall biosynthesis